MSEHFSPLTLDIKTGVVSDEDTTEIWVSVKEVVIVKVRRNKNRASGRDSLLIDEEEVEKSFCLNTFIVTSMQLWSCLLCVCLCVCVVRVNYLYMIYMLSVISLFCDIYDTSTVYPA